MVAKTLNQKKILEIVEHGARVLDLGCGNGKLLKLLQEKKQVKGYGVEIDEEYIIECVSNGISVLQGNIDEGLRDYGDNSFDYCLLIQTLQVVNKPRVVIEEMLRVGKKAIITFPNFAYWPMRLQLLFNGRMPISRIFPYAWYNNPNIHMLTINDFKKFCQAHNIDILMEYFPVWLKMTPNILAQTGLFVIQRK